jgi:hypothetical protein
MTELFVGVRDGYVAGEVVIGRARTRGDGLPPYARAARETERRSPDVRDATLAGLALRFPGMVRRVVH